MNLMKFLAAGARLAPPKPAHSPDVVRAAERPSVSGKIHLSLERKDATPDGSVCGA